MSVYGLLLGVAALYSIYAFLGAGTSAGNPIQPVPAPKYDYRKEPRKSAKRTYVDGVTDPHLHKRHKAIGGAHADTGTETEDVTYTSLEQQSDALLHSQIARKRLPKLVELQNEKPTEDPPKTVRPQAVSAADDPLVLPTSVTGALHSITHRPRSELSDGIHGLQKFFHAISDPFEQAEQVRNLTDIP